jgi:hypothetical protein
LRVLTKEETISDLAEEKGVSRKFLDKQGHIAQNALTIAFEKPKADKEVLFYLSVTYTRKLFQQTLSTRTPVN